ncbi:MAG: DUF5686 family protein [Dysgonamonadaceae bacterium]|nr:DUF5686 family protein [Dysgonamonadaceae bacterium]
MAYELQEIITKPQRRKYSRKDNPAVEIIRQAIKHKNDNRLESKDRYQVEVYEKLAFSADEFEPNADDNLILKKFPLLHHYIDTSAFSKKPVLNLSLREKLYKTDYCKAPEMRKNHIIAQRHVGLDKTFDEDETLTFNIEELFKGVHIFDDDIPILLNRFVSPLSSLLAVYYYEYSIDDTITVNGKQYVNITYLPASRRSYGFLGQLQIALDGTWSVSRASLIVSKNINLNWVDKMRIEQVFQPSPEGTQLMISEDIYADFRPHKGVMPLQAHLFRSFRNYSFDAFEQPDKTASKIDWKQMRHEPLLKQEQRIDSMMVELKTNNTYRFLNKTLEILTSGYIPIRFDKSKSKVDFGPVGSTFSSNVLEGARFRWGGMTTAQLNPHGFANGYIAYGLKDKRWKYQGRMIYTFQPRKIHPLERPIHNLSLTHQYDVFVPGGNSPFNDGDNVFNSLTSGIRATQMQYIRKTELRYEKEFSGNISVGAWLKHERNRAAGDLHYYHYQPDGTLTELSDYTTSAAGIQLRYAPGEKLYSGRNGKNSVFNMAKDAPIFTLSHQSSFKNVFGGDFSYNHTELRAEKRFWLSSFGQIDLIGKAGRIWDKAPFPLLYFPITNQSFFIQSETFMMMRAMEFIADDYAALYATYFLKGWILNRIPLINRLKLREVISFNATYGHLSDKNNPALSPAGLFELPSETRIFGNTPYMEASIGLDNIFRILRIDYVRRLNYTDSPNIKQSGFRMAFRFSF